jgi:plastocyanin
MKTRLFTAAGFIAACTLLFTLTASASTEFLDVPSTHPNYTAIMDLKNRGIIEGYADGTFKPDQNVNRVEALKIILYGAKVIIDQNDTSSKFSDTEEKVWYSPILNTAVSKKIVEGYPDGTFRPAKTINLVEALKITQLSFNIDLTSIKVLEDPYADTPKTEWYAKYMQYAKNNNLIDADSENKVYPDQPMTRGKITELIYRLLGKIENNKNETPIITDIVLNVAIQKYYFSPKEMQIGLGSTVTWKNLSTIEHTVTSDSGLFDSGTLPENGIFTHKFEKIGTYTYHCKFFPTMKGTIVVKPANQIPTI